MATSLLCSNDTVVISHSSRGLKVPSRCLTPGSVQIHEGALLPHFFCPCVLRCLCLDSVECAISLRFSVPFPSQAFSWSLFLFFPSPISLVSSLHEKRGLTLDHLHLCHLTFLSSSHSSNAFMATDVFPSRV